MDPLKNNEQDKQTSFPTAIIPVNNDKKYILRQITVKEYSL